MKLIRRFLILSHRYLGIALSLLFAMWFATGIAMIYGRSLPRMTPELRLDRLEPLDIARVRVSAAEAATRAELTSEPNQVSLVTVMGRPAYRFGSRVVFADTGEPLRRLSDAHARTIASQFTRIPADRLSHVATLESPDQWTLTVRQSPLYKFAADDDAGTEVYVSGRSADVVMFTTRASRALAWVGAIPHFMYFTWLRTQQELWRAVVLWTSGVGIVLAALGVILGLVQLRISRPLRLTRLSSWLPYSGLMRWHYITGLVFGIFTFTFVFSGWLSMEPWGWATSAGRFGGGLREAFTSSPGLLSDFPVVDAGRWAGIQQDGVLTEIAIKEIEHVRIQDQAYYVVRRTLHEDARTENRGHQPYYADRSQDPGRLLIAAQSLERHQQAFSSESLLERVRTAVPDAQVVASTLLSSYDSYYYSRERAAPLPVLRVKMNDPESTWLYIDPLMSQLVGRVHRLDRVERWIYNGFHSLDFAFWYDKRPLWDIVMITLCLGGFSTSMFGVVLGWRRVRRAVVRAASGAAASERTPSPEPTR